LLSAVIKAGTANHLKKEGVSPKIFKTYAEEAEWLLSQPVVPSREVFTTAFPDFRWRNRVEITDIPVLITQLKKSYQMGEMQSIIEKAAKDLKKMTPVDVAAQLKNSVNNILEASGVNALQEVVTSEKDWLKEFKKRQEGREEGKIAGVSTGSPTIDLHTGGLQKGQLYIAIARQGNAKTYWMLRVTAQALLDGKRVLWVSREMPEDMVRMRLYSIMSSIIMGKDKAFSNLGLILGRQDIDYGDLRKFLKKMREVIKGRLFIPQDRRISVRGLAAYAQRIAPDMIVYDYLGIMAGGEGKKGWQEIGEEANILKEMAMEYDCPVLVAAQVNRAAADLEDEAPMVEHIAFSDSIGYAADLVFALVISAADPGNPYADRVLEIWLRKARYGAKDTMVQLRFNGDKGYVEEVKSALGEVQNYKDATKKKKKEDKKNALKGKKKLKKAA